MLVENSPLDVVGTLLVTTDRVTEPVDVIFLFGRAHGDDNKEFFQTVAKLYRQGTAKNIIINGSDGERIGGNIPGEAWAGKIEWTKHLVELGVSREHIHYALPSFHTAGEGRAMFSYAHSKGWKTAIIVAQPHQLLRCMAGLIHYMRTVRNWMRIYCVAPTKCDWFELTAGSQGLNEMERIDHIPLEYSRIHKYIDDLATMPEVIVYYRNRGKIL